jgi:aldehyde dehydrogenase (NAD+)
MHNPTHFYIGGRWTAPAAPRSRDIINPATEEAIGQVSLGGEADVDQAVAAARAAFAGYSQSSVAERLALLQRIVEIYQRRYDEMAAVISREMGAPITLAKQLQASGGLFHLTTAVETLKSFAFEEKISQARVVKQPIGVCGLISPWNWPIAQVTAKVAPALATGCTMVLKPSEIAPLSAMLFAEILDEAGVPPGVFNLVNGLGGEVGACIARHPGIDMVSFTGSTRAGVEVTRAAAASVKRVTLELGGKSANVVLDDARLEVAVPQGVMAVMANSGQTCVAPTRMLVPRRLQAQVLDIARATLDAVVVGQPDDPATFMGPLSNVAQFEKVNSAVQRAADEGVRLGFGGAGRPERFRRGYFVQPTLFADVDNRSAIAREEIFGPVLAVIPYDSEEEAIRIANDSPYGLAGYVQSADAARAAQVAMRLEAGYIVVNQANFDFGAPFGGFKQSGNGREWGQAGFDEYLERKSILA